MTLPASLEKGSRLKSLSITHPGKAPPTTEPPIVVTLTDSAGKVRARWSVDSGQTFSWSDLAGFLWDDTITVSATGAIATAKGEMRRTGPSSGGG